MTVQVLEISIDFVYNLAGLELIRDRFSYLLVRVKTIWEVGNITYLK